MSDLRLNPSQKKAVEHASGPLMIIAGAGTGKTNVITQRIAWIIEQKLAKPNEIVALTFTEKAAHEMSERLEKIIEHRAIEVQCSTFHGFCQQIISRYGLEIGVTPGAPLLSEVQLWLLMNREFEKFKLDYYKPRGNPTKFLRSLIRHILRAKDENISVERYREFAEKLRLDTGSVDGPDGEDARRYIELAEAYATYQEIMLGRGVMDFGDLMLYANKLVAERPSVRARLQQRIKYIVVDEFQDTNMAQYDLVRALLGPEQNITVVGDDDQAIYKFRGASVDNILQFRTHYPARTEVFLTENYRSRQEILDVAYTLIQCNNPYRLEVDEAGVSTGAKKLTAFKGVGGTVEARQFPTGIREAKWIAREVAGSIEGGREPCEIAILARAASHLEETAGELRRAGVPYVIAQTDGLLKTRVVIDILALLRGALERFNSNAWYQIAISRISSVTPEDLVECVAAARKNNLPLARVLLSEPPEGLSDVGKAALVELAGKIKIDAEFLRTNKASAVLYKLLDQSGYFKVLVREIESGAQVAMQEMPLIQQFLDFAAEWEAQHPSATPYDFLADCDRLLELGEEAQQESDGMQRSAVQLLTIHASKGLEFQEVFVVSAIEGRFPSVERSDGIELPAALVREKTMPEDHHTHEERRLAYVAFTRAKESLHISCAEKYSTTESARQRKPSRFIAEAGCIIAPLTIESIQEDAEELEIAESTAAPIALETSSEFSFTQLKNFDTCPYQYWFAHVLRLPQKAKWSMNFGKSLHSTLQHWYELLRDEGMAPVPPVEKLIELLHADWISEGYSSQAHLDEKRAEAEGILREYYKKHESRWHVPAFIEQRFRVVIGGEVLKGSIDRLDILPDGSVEIIDYKSGEPKVSDDLKFKDKEQLLIYELAAERQLGLKANLLSYYYLQDQSKASFVSKQKDIEKIEEFVAETVAEIRKGQFPAKPSPYTCASCDFKDICPYRDL